MPPTAEWFANIDNPNTRRAYRKDLRAFMGFVGVAKPEEFRLVSRAHVLAWREDLERREFAGSTLRRKLAALSSLFESLCERGQLEREAHQVTRSILETRTDIAAATRALDRDPERGSAQAAKTWR